MKNIHLLPTDKPSRLGYLTKKGKEVFNDLRLFEKPMPNILDSENQNIYITSEEEIKEGVDQWYLDKFLNKPRNSSGSQYAKKQDVIILTTDQDLIENGVQAIDDDFLEWFVENPSCERVKVEDYGNLYNFRYLILIPKEEPKQETLEEAAEKHSELQAGTFTPTHKTTYKHGFEDGAKWQSERMYSKEEVEQIITQLMSTPPKKWFEQLKK